VKEGQFTHSTLVPSGDHRRGVVVIDHVTVRGGVWAAARRRGTPLVFNLQPGLAQCLGEVVVHRAGDGHGVGGGGLGLLVVLPKTAAEMLLNHRVTGGVGYRTGRIGEGNRESFYFP